MNFAALCHVLTVILVVLKLTDNIEASWLLVLLPSIIAVSTTVVVLIVIFVVGLWAFSKERTTYPLYRR